MATEVFLYQNVALSQFNVKIAIRNLLDIALKHDTCFRLQNGRVIKNYNDLERLDYSEFTPLSTTIKTPKIYYLNDSDIMYTGQIELAFKNYHSYKMESILTPSDTAYEILYNHKELFRLNNVSDLEINKISQNILLTIPFETSDDLNFLIKIAYDYMCIYPQSFLVIYIPEIVLFLDDVKRLIKYITISQVDLSLEDEFVKIWSEIQLEQKNVNIINWINL